MMCSFAFFLVFRFTFETWHTGQGICMSGCVEMWQLQQPKNSPTVQHSTKEQKVLRSGFSVLGRNWVRLPCTALYYLLQHSRHSYFPSLVYQIFKVLLAVCGWGWVGGCVIHLNGSRYFHYGYHCLHYNRGTTGILEAYLHREERESFEVHKSVCNTPPPPHPPCLLFKASRTLNEPIKWAKNSQNYQIFASTLLSLCSLGWTSSLCETRLSSVEIYWLRNASSQTIPTWRETRKLVTNSRAFKNTLYSRTPCRMLSSVAFFDGCFLLLLASFCRPVAWGQTLKGTFQHLRKWGNRNDMINVPLFCTTALSAEHRIQNKHRSKQTTTALKR